MCLPGGMFFKRALPGICALTRVAHPSDQALLEMPCIRISCRPYRIHDESQPRNTAQCGEGTSEPIQNWHKIQAVLSTSTTRWRLHKPDESAVERVVLNTIAVAKQGIQSITNLFNNDVSAFYLSNTN